MIPEGWQSVPLADIAKSKIVYGIVQAGPHDPTGVPYLKSSDIGGQIDCSSLQRTAPEIHQRFGRSTVVPGDIVISLRGNIGDTSIVPDELAEANLTQGTARISVAEDFDRDFVFFQLASFDVQRRIHSVTKGSTFVEITLEDLRKIEIPVPQCRRQQRYIADLFLDWNRAIETVEALIANVRAQKKALMQQLLPQGTTPPKIRLPGFSGEWRETTIEDVASVLVSNVDKKSVKGERPVRLCNYMDVYRSDQIVTEIDFMAATATEAQIRKFGLKVGDVVITKDSETPDDIAIPTIVQSTAPDLICGYHLAILRPKDGTDGQFLKFYFEHPRTRHFFASRANGATRFGLTVGAIETAPISLPSHAEQKEIGNVILAAETEIHRLNPILTALCQEKAALMQQLLTGKRRAKLPDSEVA